MSPQPHTPAPPSHRRTAWTRRTFTTFSLLAILASPLASPLSLPTPAHAANDPSTASRSASARTVTSRDGAQPQAVNARHDDWDDDWDDDWEDDWNHDCDGGVVGEVLAPGCDPTDPVDPATDDTGTTPDTNPDATPDTTPDTDGNQKKVITVASVNINRYMPRAKVLRDRDAALSRGSLDVIGWQEADKYRESFDAYASKGWETTRPNGASGCPISWRRSVFEFVSTRTVLLNAAHHGGPAATWTARTAHVLTLKHRATGQHVTVINAHMVPHIENHSRPGTPRSNLASRVASRALKRLANIYASSASATTIGTGDLNWDYLADSRVRSPRYVLGRLGPVAESSYERLGTQGLLPTHGTRLIDYVFLQRNSKAQFLSHRTLQGYRSDHRPLLAKVSLR